LIYAQVAKGVAAIMLRNKLKVPDALAQATTAGVRDPPKGFDRKIVHGHLKLVARDGAVASRADDAYAAAASMEADTSLTPKAALDAARTARLRLEGLSYEHEPKKGQDQWFLDGAPEPITRVDHAEALSLRLIDEGLVGLRYDADERVKVAFDKIVREYYAVDGLEYEWSGSKRFYFIPGCADACGSLRIRSRDDARACSDKLKADGLFGRGLDDPRVRDIFEEYAKDTSGRTQAVRDALGMDTSSLWGTKRARAMAELVRDVSVDAAAAATMDWEPVLAEVAVAMGWDEATLIDPPQPPREPVAAPPPPREPVVAPPSRERAAAAGTRSSGLKRKAARR